MTTISKRLDSITPERLRAMRRGIEKESLRSQASGSLALTPHPAALGSALTHPLVTTDFSESQVELITGAHDSVDACLTELTQIHQAVYRALNEEMLWVSSMPCGLPGDETIPLARYGTSNVGRAKSVYRMGLGHRYGRRMQTISGIHYNWSLPGLSNADYFSLIRNFRRNSFVLLALFGAAPAVCSSFLQGRQHDLEPMRSGTLYRPYATSLRMGRLGYQSDAQSTISVSYNNLEDYAAALRSAMTTPYPPYERVGVKNPGGEYNQLSSSLLQIENEFYGLIRPKRTTHSGERPVPALLARGVEYIEVRCLDLNPFDPVGINASTMRMIDIFLMHCLLSDSPPDSPEEILALARNLDKVTSRGREPGLQLELNGETPTLVDTILNLLDTMDPIALALDQAHGGGHYLEALLAAKQAAASPQTWPSANVLQSLNDSASGSYIAFVRERSQATMNAILSMEWKASDAAHFAELATRSKQAQADLEQADALSFDDYLTGMLQAV
jgi:glutamate--cysteine ligase